MSSDKDNEGLPSLLIKARRSSFLEKWEVRKLCWTQPQIRKTLEHPKNKC